MTTPEIYIVCAIMFLWLFHGLIKWKEKEAMPTKPALSAADIKKRAQNLHLHRPVAEDRPEGANRRTKGLKSSGRHNRDVHNFIFLPWSSAEICHLRLQKSISSQQSAMARASRPKNGVVKSATKQEPTTVKICRFPKCAICPRAYLWNRSTMTASRFKMWRGVW